MQSSMLGEIDKILSRGDDVMIKRKRENGKPVDVVFAIRLNIAAKEEVRAEESYKSDKSRG